MCIRDRHIDRAELIGRADVDLERGAQPAEQPNADGMCPVSQSGRIKQVSEPVVQPDLARIVVHRQIGAAHRADRLELETARRGAPEAVSYTHLRAHETVLDLVCRLLLEKKKI